MDCGAKPMLDRVEMKSLLLNIASPRLLMGFQQLRAKAGLAACTCALDPGTTNPNAAVKVNRSPAHVPRRGHRRSTAQDP